MIGSQRQGAIGGHEAVLVGERVALRPHTVDTLPALKRWYADPELVRLARHRNEPLTGDEVGRLVRDRLYLLKACVINGKDVDSAKEPYLYNLH